MAQELSLILLVGALSVTLAIVIGERIHVWWMSESGIAILVGGLIGFLWWIYASYIANDATEEARALEILEFQPAVFTLLLLPPIIFESGYNLNHSFFFSNIGAILVFAFLGTVIAFAITAPSLYYGLGGAHGLLTPMEACAFSALISAVDPVATLTIFSSTGADPKLNALIFGESVLNDAVAIVLFKTFVQLGISSPFVAEGLGALTAAQVFHAIGSFCLIFVGSVAIGALGGCSIALLFKLVGLRTLPPHVAAPAELIVLICLSYSTFLAAEYAILVHASHFHTHALLTLHTPKHQASPRCSFTPSTEHFMALNTPTLRYAHLSGIVASLFCGAVCVIYVKRNLTPAGAQLSDTIVRALAKFAETVIFVLIGYGE